jgi:hypothetical protein
MGRIILLEDLLTTGIRSTSDMNLSDLQTLIEAEAACNGALEKWLRGEIDEETFCDVLEYYGHDMDDYFEIVDYNFDVIGLD